MFFQPRSCFARGGLGFSFLFRFLKNFLHFDWPREVSSATSSGSFLDLNFVQVILGIVVVPLAQRFPFFDYGWTSLLSAPSARVRGALLRKLFRLSSYLCRILESCFGAGKNPTRAPLRSISYTCILILCRNPSILYGSSVSILGSLTQIYVLLLSPSSPLADCWLHNQVQGICFWIFCLWACHDLVFQGFHRLYFLVGLGCYLLYKCK